MKKWLHLKTVSIITTSLLLFASMSYADEPDNNSSDNNQPTVSTILQQILAQLTDFHANTIADFAKLFNPSLSYDNLIKNRAVMEKAGSWMMSDAKAPTNSDVQKSLALSTQSYYQALNNSANAVSRSLNNNNASTTQQFSISSLLDNYAIENNSDGMQQAQQYIQFLSGQANPLIPPTTNMNTPTAKNKIPVQQYKAALGTFTAAQSAALNTLYKALAARTVQPGLGTSAGIPGKPDASPLEVEQHMVNLPFTPDWSQKILKDANPADIQRQQLFMLAGIQNLLFENRMQMEQLNVNLAALILQTQQDSTRKGLTDMRNQAVRSLR